MFNIIQKVHHDIFVVKMVFHGDFQGMYIYIYMYSSFKRTIHKSQGTIGCTPNSVPRVFIVFSRDSWG